MRQRSGKVSRRASRGATGRAQGALCDHSTALPLYSTDRRPPPSPSVAQLTDALEELGVPVNEELAAAILKEIDADGSGSVSLEEFANFCVGLADRTWRPVTVETDVGVYSEGLGAGACAIIRGGAKLFEQMGKVELAMRREMR